MSYDWTMTSAVFQIKKKNLAKVREALNRHASLEGAKPHLHVSDLCIFDEKNSDAKIIGDIFCNDFGLDTGFVPNTGDLDEIHQEGSKLGDLEDLFQVIAPFVENDCFVAGRGEEGELWRWVFEDGKCYDQPGVIVFDDGDCPLKEYCDKGCPFALICTASGHTVLRTSKCQECGGELILKDMDGEAEPLAATTCKCMKRKFDVK